MQQHKDNHLVVMGYVAAPFGVQGWVKIKVATENVDALANYQELLLRFPSAELSPQRLVKSFSRDGLFYAKFAGIENRDQAFALRGATVEVARESFPTLPSDEYYWADLIGLQVVNLQGELLGMVKNLLETGANDVLVVDSEGRKQEDQGQYLIPFVEVYIKRVELADKLIVVDWGIDY